MLLDPINSVANFPFYKEVPKKSIGATIGYLAYVGVFFSLALTLALYIRVRPMITEFVDWAATSIPPMTLSQGKMTSNLTAPVLIRHPQVKEIAFILDTNRTEPVTQQEMEDKKIIAYVTQNMMYLILDEKMKPYDFSKAKKQQPLVINANFYQTFGKTLNRILYPAALVSSWIMFILWKHIAALVYSLLALLFNAITSADLNYSALYKISLYAQTPVIFLQIATFFFPADIPYFWVVELLVLGVYLWQGIRQQIPPLPEAPTTAIP